MCSEYVGSHVVESTVRPLPCKLGVIVTTQRVDRLLHELRDFIYMSGPRCRVWTLGS